MSTLILGISIVAALVVSGVLIGTVIHLTGCYKKRKYQTYTAL